MARSEGDFLHSVGISRLRCFYHQGHHGTPRNEDHGEIHSGKPTNKRGGFHEKCPQIGHKTRTATNCGSRKCLKINGRGEWIRTTDLTVPKRALYKAEPRPDKSAIWILGSGRGYVNEG